MPTDIRVHSNLASVSKIDFENVAKWAYAKKCYHEFKNSGLFVLDILDETSVKEIKEILDNISSDIGEIGCWCDDEWESIKMFIGKSYEIIHSTSSKKNADANPYEEFIKEDFSEKRKRLVPRPEKFSDFANAVLFVVDEAHPIHFEKDRQGDFLRSLAIIHAHHAREYLDNPETLHRIARKIEASRIKENAPSLDEVYQPEQLEKIVREVEESLNNGSPVDIKWEFAKSKRMGSEKQDNTVTQRLRNELGEDKSKPKISFDPSEMLDGQDIGMILSLHPEYQKNTADLPKPANSEATVFLFQNLALGSRELNLPERTEKDIRERMELIQNYIEGNHFNGKIQVGFIVTKPGSHHINVILEYDKGKFCRARVADSLPASPWSVSNEVAKYIKKALADESDKEKVTQGSTFIEQVGSLCGDLALIDLQKQLGIKLFDVDFDEIKKERKNAGRKIRIGVYRTVAKAIAKTDANGDKDKERKMLSNLNQKIDNAINKEIESGLLPSGKPDLSGSRGRSAEASDKPDNASDVSAVKSQNKKTRPSDDEDTIERKVKETEPADDEGIIERKGKEAEPVVKSSQDLSQNEKAISPSNTDLIQNKEEKDGSQTWAGEILTARITKDKDSQTPTLEFSFSDSKNEVLKQMNEAQKEQKYKDEFNGLLKKLHGELSSSKNNWKTNGEGKIIVDILISGMSPQEQARLEECVRQSEHFALGKVERAHDKKPPEKTGLPTQSMMNNMKKAIKGDNFPEEKSNRMTVPGRR